MAITVTATQGGSTAASLLLRVYVLTGAKPVAQQTGGSASNVQTALTVTATGTVQQSTSHIYGADAIGTGNPGTVSGSGTTIVDNVPDSTNTESYITFKNNAPSTGSQALGVIITNDSPQNVVWLEILAAGTIAEDASAPPEVDGSGTSAISVQTASFTPKPGSLLVAVVSSDGGTGTTTMTVSGGGLSWTEAVKSNSPAGVDYTGVWIADVPPAGATASARPGYTWARRFKHRQTQLPVPPVPPPLRPASIKPGSTWARRFKHRQAALPFAVPAAAAPAPVYPLRGPVSAGSTSSGPADNSAARFPARGRTYSNAGVYNQVGPPFRPDSSPVACGSTSAASSSRNGARLPARGRTASNAGIRGQLGPQVYSLQHPVAAVTRPLPSRGRAYSRSGIYGQLGPPFFAQPKPLQARHPLPLRGRTYTRTGIFGQLGPPVYPLLHPVAAVTRPLPSRGRTYSRTGVYGQPGPQVYPLLHPVAAVTRPLQQRGRTYSRAGIYGQLGPQFFAQPKPVQARRPLPSRGRTAASAAPAPVAPPPNQTVIYPPGRPAAAVTRPLPSRGRAYSRAGTYGQLGPPVAALQQPAGVRRILLRQGSAQAKAGPVGGLGPPVYPLLHPVQARRPLPPRGRVSASFAPAPVTPPPNLTAYYPLGHPVQSRRPLPPRGLCRTNVAIPYQFAPPAPPPLQQPIQARRPLPPRGRSASNPGAPVTAAPPNQTVYYPLGHPAAAVTRPLPRRGRAQHLAGVYGQAGPPVRPLQGPVCTRWVARFSKGRVCPSSPGTRGGTGAQVYPLLHPVSAVSRPRPPRGACRTNVSIPFAFVPPPPAPLQHPAGLRNRAPGPFRKGRTSSLAGTFTPVVPHVTVIATVIGIPQAKWHTRQARVRWQLDPTRS